MERPEAPPIQVTERAVPPLREFLGDGEEGQLPRIYSRGFS